MPLFQSLEPYLCLILQILLSSNVVIWNLWKIIVICTHLKSVSNRTIVFLESPDYVSYSTSHGISNVDHKCKTILEWNCHVVVFVCVR